MHPTVSYVRLSRLFTGVRSRQIKDCSLPILGDVFFIILILWGSFFTLNLLLAVLEGNFTKGKEDDKVKKRKNLRTSIRSLYISLYSGLDRQKHALVVSALSISYSRCLALQF